MPLRGGPLGELETLVILNKVNKEQCILGEAHFCGKREGFNSDLVLVGLSTDQANTRRRGKLLSWQFLLGLWAVGGYLSLEGFPNKYGAGFFRQTLLAL